MKSSMATSKSYSNVDGVGVDVGVVMNQMKHPSILFLYLPIVFLPILGIFKGDNFYLNFLIVLLFNVLILMDMKDKKGYLFSPSFISIFYLYINFIFGELLFYNDIFKLAPDKSEYYSMWKTLDRNTLIYNICTLLIVLSYLNARPMKTRIFRFKRIPWLNGITCLISLLIILLSKVDILIQLLPFFSILLIGMSSKLKTPVRFIAYMLVVGLIVALNPDNKRESIFLLYPIVFIEALKIRKIKLKYIFMSFGGAAFVFIAIVVMSIMRAEMADNFLSSLNMVSVYITSDAALSLVADNFEISWCYINTFQSMEFINNDSSLLGWGISYLKPLFWPISRDIWPDKPESTMLLYTAVYDKARKIDGLSLPIPIVSDLYWNFKYFAIPFVYIVHYWLNNIYKTGLRVIRDNQNNVELCTGEFAGLYFMFVFLLLMRGCGLDLYLIYLIVFYILLKTVIYCSKK